MIDRLDNEALLEIGRLIALKESIESSSYRRPVAILAPLDWIDPHLEHVYGLPVWRSGRTTKAGLVFT